MKGLQIALHWACIMYNLQDVSQKPPPLFDSDSDDDWFS